MNDNHIGVSVLVDYVAGGLYGVWNFRTGQKIMTSPSLRDCIEYAEELADSMVREGIWDDAGVILSDACHALAFNEW